jgi:hypothetical protein
MWLHEDQLRRLGFRRRSAGYWSCLGRFGLRGEEHISVFARSELALPGRGRGEAGLMIELTEFHVTLPVGENLHFYYHEARGSEWAPGGQTSSTEVRRLGLDPFALRDRADKVAGLLALALGGSIGPRSGVRSRDGTD